MEWTVRAARIAALRGFASWRSQAEKLGGVGDWLHQQEAAVRELRLAGDGCPVGSVEQLLVLANMEGMNADFIHMGLPQGERLKRLNQIAFRQMQVLTFSNLNALPGVKGR